MFKNKAIQGKVDKVTKQKNVTCRGCGNVVEWNGIPRVCPVCSRLVNGK